MTDTFRVKVRVKKFKPAPPVTLPPFMPAIDFTAKTKCARCGMVWDGPMAYCCPEGQMCGVPRQPQFVGWVSTPPHTIGYGSVTSVPDPRLQLWN